MSNPTIEGHIILKRECPGMTDEYATALMVTADGRPEMCAVYKIAPVLPDDPWLPRAREILAAIRGVL